MFCSRWFKLLCEILVASLLVSFFPQVIYAENLSPRFYSVNKDLEFEASAYITSTWDKYANIEITVANTGDMAIHNWYVSFDMPYMIENAWNAIVFDHDETGVYTLHNSVWNQDIYPGEMVTFGLTVYSEDNEKVEIVPTFYLLNTCVRSVDSSCYSFSYTEYSNWGDGFNGLFTFENTSSETIEDWMITFCSNRVITDVSGASLSSHENTIVFSNDNYTQNLEEGTSCSFTVVGDGTNSVNELSISEMNVYSVSYAYKLNDDFDLDGIPDYLELISFGDEELIVSPTPSPTNTPEETVTPSPTGDPVPCVSITPTTTVCPSGDGITVSLSEMCYEANQGYVYPKVFCTALEDNVQQIRILGDDRLEKAELLDDGDLLSSGDEVADDCIFTCKLEIDTNIPESYIKQEYLVEVQYFDGAKIEYRVFIDIISSVSSSQFNVAYADAYLGQYTDSQEYDDDSCDIRRTKILDILYSLESKGFIKSASIASDENSVIYEIIDFGWIRLDYSKLESNQHNSSANPTSSPKNNRVVLKDAHVDSIIFFDFEDSRLFSYIDMNNSWKALGINALVIVHPCIEEYRETLDNANLSIFSGHGLYDGNYQSSMIQTGIVIDIRIQSDVQYYQNLNNQDVNGTDFVFGRCSSNLYVVDLMPHFFEKYYSTNSKLDNTCVVIENCLSAGAKNTSHYELLNAFQNCGAKYISGYVNTVQGQYAKDFTNCFVEELIRGNSTGNSFASARNTVGFTDEQYCKTLNDEPHDGYYAYPEYIGSSTRKVFDVQVTPTAIPTSTPIPTPTVVPTATPIPTAITTATPIPTATPFPTSVPVSPTIIPRSSPIDVMYVVESSPFTSLEDVERAETEYKYAYFNQISGDNIYFGRELSWSTVIGDVNGYDFSADKRHEVSVSRIESLKKRINGNNIPDYDIICVDQYIAQAGSSIGHWALGEDPQPSYFNSKSFVFYITNESGSYMSGQDNVMERALEYIEMYNFHIFVVNLSGSPISEELLDFITGTGGCELTGTPEENLNVILLVN